MSIDDSEQPKNCWSADSEWKVWSGTDETEKTRSARINKQKKSVSLHEGMSKKIPEYKSRSYSKSSFYV